MNHGWQSESTDGPCFFGVAAMLQWSPGLSPHPQLLDVVWCSAAIAVVVV